MEQEPLSSEPSARDTTSFSSTTVLVVISVGTALFLWLTYSTNLSLYGTLLDLLFIPLAGVVGYICWGKARHMSEGKPRTTIRLFSLVSLVGTVPPILIGLCMWVPPFTLGAIFVTSEIVGEERAQTAVSPDRAWVADVRFQGTGAYTGGLGRVSVSVRHSLFPLIEQDIFYESRSNFNPETTTFIRWIDEDSLYILESEEVVEVGDLEWHIPAMIRVPLLIGRLFVDWIGEFLSGRELTHL